jgi:Outer membrane protein beta-barrel domain
MKKIIFLTLFVFGIMGLSANAQTKKPDKIFRKDGGLIEGKVINASVGKVEYLNLLENDGVVYIVSGYDVAKIEYADGTIKDYTLKDKKKKVATTTITDKSKPSESAYKPTTVKKTSRTKKGFLDSPRFVLGFGVEGTYVLEPLSKKWVSVNDSAAIQQGYGFNIQADYHITKGVGFSFGVGLNQWQVQRNFLQKEAKTQVNTIQYSSLDKFSMIPIHLGLKLYIAKGFYIMPDATYNVISSKLETKDGLVQNPSGNNVYKFSSNNIGYGGGIGCEVYKSPFVIDLSARFQTANFNQFRGIDEPLSYAGLRLNIGFDIAK